jgi:hypothetical protein
VIVVQVHHAIGRLPGSPLNDYVWETLPLGGQQETFQSQDDPAIQPLVARLLTRPDIIGVRLVFEPDELTSTVSTGVQPVLESGAVLATFGR